MCVREGERERESDRESVCVFVTAHTLCDPSRARFELPTSCLPNMAHIRQSRPDSMAPTALTLL